MCGIAGFTGANDLPRLIRMIGTLTHRGPDSSGAWEAPGVSLGMRRLAIVDIATGEQPMFNEDGSIAVVFNGEIYNHVELRRALRDEGHVFRSDHSDTEVIVHLYEQHGLDFLQHLNGMFAIALWDANERQLVLARDRLGIKPLYLARIDDGVVFGSEPKALLAHPKIAREPNLLAIHHYFSFKNVPAPYSAFQRDRAAAKRGAGGLQGRPDRAAEVVDAHLRSTGRCRRDRSRRVYPGTTRRQRPAADALGCSLRRLSFRWRRFVERRCTAGPLGARAIKTFTLVYEDDFPKKDNDRRFARAVAEQYGTEHHEHLVRFNDLPEKLDHIIRSFDEPFSGVISTYFITQSISKHVKVALSGDGADELFGSYLSHRVAAPLAAYMAGRNDPDSLVPFENDLGAAWRRWRCAATRPRRRMGLYLMDDAQKQSLYSPLMQNAIKGQTTEGWIRHLMKSCTSNDPTNRALFLDLETLLPDQVLPFVDRLSMAHSVEVRPPFLDHRLAEFACSLPGSIKIKAGRVKSILKNAVARPPAAGLDRAPQGGLHHADQRVADRQARRLRAGDARTGAPEDRMGCSSLSPSRKCSRRISPGATARATGSGIC